MSVNAIQAEGGIIENAEYVLAKIEQMRERILGVCKSTDALERS